MRCLYPIYIFLLLTGENLSFHHAFDRCCLNFTGSCGLVQRILQPYKLLGISWQSMKNHTGKFLIIDSRKSSVTFIDTNNSNDGFMSFSTGWFNEHDLKRLNRITKSADLPSIILPLNRNDWPISSSKENVIQPFVSYCEKDSFSDILWPAMQMNYDNITDTIDTAALKWLDKNHWLAKEKKLWFRGTYNWGATKGRFTILNETTLIPNLVDVGLTICWNHSKHICGNMVKDFMSLPEAMTKYRYILVLDGVCAANRLQEILGRNVVVLKPYSPERQWFSTAMQAWVHYIPIDLKPFEVSEWELAMSHKKKRNIHQHSDIKAIMEWIIVNDDKVYDIIQNAHQFYIDYLSEEAVDCYIRVLVRRLSKLYRFNVTDKIDSLMVAMMEHEPT